MASPRYLPGKDRIALLLARCLPSVAVPVLRRLGARAAAVRLSSTALLLVWACAPASEPRVPNVAPVSTLDIASVESSRPAPFAIAHVSPEGPSESDPSVFVVLSRPARPLGPDQPVPEGLSLSPPVPGHWEWVGSHALSFVPDRGVLPRASSFEVTIPAGIRALDGAILSEPSTFSFQSPRPRVTGMTPQRWDRSVHPGAPVLLEFSQEVKATALTSHVTAESEDGLVPIRVTPGNTGHQLRVVAEKGWPLDREIKVVVASGWVGSEGALGATHRFEETFHTYGPLTATLDCQQDARGHCRPEGWISLRFSNPVQTTKLLGAVRADGVRLRLPQWSEPDSRTSYLDLGIRLEPRQSFTVVVDPVVDIYGQPLRWVKNRQVVVADYRPAVRLGFAGDSFLPEQGTVAIQARNSAYELVVARAGSELLDQLDALPHEQRFAKVVDLPGARHRKVPLGKLNEWQKTSVQLDSIAKQGLFVVGVRYLVDGREHSEVRWGQRTDLGVTAKSGRDRTHAWVTRLSTGAPVAGAEVRVLGKSGRGVSDESGLVTLPPGAFLSYPERDRKSEWLEVRLGDEVAYRNSGDRIGPWRLPVDSDYWGRDDDLAMLFVERDLFRPGERAWVKGYLRRPVSTGTSPVRNEKLAIELVSPTGEVTQTLPVQTNEVGALAERLHIPRSAGLGYWTLRLRRGESILTASGVQVAEYRPSAFEVKVQTETPSVIAGSAIRWQVEGAYFSGGEMGGAGVETSVRREHAWFCPPGFEESVCDDGAWQQLEDYRPHSVFLESQKERLSPLGQLTRETSSRLLHQVGPERLEFEATVTDLSAQTVSSRAGVLVHPAAYYPVIVPLESQLIDAPGSVSPKLLAVTPEGRVLVGRELSVTLHRLRWTYSKRPGSGGATQTSSEPVRDLIARCTIKTATEARSCELAVPHSGQYLLRATAKDQAGRSVSSSLSFYGLGDGGSAAWHDDEERGIVELSLDREIYQQGQTARLLVKSPFERARAWVTVERNGVIAERVQELTGPSPSVLVPITKDMQPNAFVGVHLIEDRRSLGGRAHAIPESYRFGYAELRLDPKERELTVHVQADKASYQPREEVELRFDVEDRRGTGHEAEVAVFVIDEGVLSLSGYQLADPLETFLRPRPLRVETLESRESMARIFGFEPNSKENKGDPGGGGDGDRANMLTAAYFNPSVVTDARGQARVRFRLPDNVGRFRVMAVAVSKDDFFGRGRTGITVNQPLMLRPALPRFLRAGDRFEAALSVQDLAGSGGEALVEATLAGAELLSPGKQVLSLAEEKTGLLRFDAKVDQVGAASFRFAATSPAGKDAVRVSRPIHSPAQLEAVALYGKTQAAEGHRLGQLDDVRRDMGKLDVTLSSSALVGLEGGFEQLWDYPYACSEQLASRALPLLLLRDFAALYGVKAPEDAEQRVADSVGLLVRRQRGDGGFGMWPESPHSAPWVSAYALWVLSLASHRGVRVEKHVFESGKRYLRNIASSRKEEDLTEAAWASFVLAQLGSPDPQTVSSLFEQVDQMSVEARTLLALAASVAKKPGLRAIEGALVERIEGAMTLRGNAAEITAPQAQEASRILSSATRRHALALLALVAAEPDHPLAAPLVRALLDARDGMGWRSTQESAFALLALDAYRRAQEQEEPEFQGLVFLGEKLLGEQRFFGRSTRAREFSVEMKELAAGGDLIFQRKGEGTLYYEARLNYARKDLPKEPLESGFSVQKRMMSVPTDPMAELPTEMTDELRLARGALVLVEVVVVAPTRRRYVVIEDPLPAGLEAIDPSLQIAQASLHDLLSRGSVGYQSAWHRSELRDDRVLYFVDDMPAGVYRYRYLARATTAGTFVVPPTRALEMYQPEVYGRTASRTVEVEHGAGSAAGGSQ